MAIAIFSFSNLELMGQSYSKKMAAKQERKLSLGAIVPAAKQVSMDRIDHTSWNGLLSKYVDAAGGVDYRGLKNSQPDSQALDAYLDHLATASLTKAAKRENQMAYWINAYNAVTVKGILQEYPTTSIRNHTSKIGGYNLWKHLLLNVGGKQASLDAIEHKVLRPMGDPRIHFAIVCASKGCPRLLNEAYVGENLNDQLNANAASFFSLPQNFQYDQRKRQFKMSSILEWFGSDFGKDQAAILKAIAPHLPTKTAQTAANANAVSISYLDYSWALNEQTPKSKMGRGVTKGRASGLSASGSGRK